MSDIDDPPVIEVNSDVEDDIPTIEDNLTVIDTAFDINSKFNKHFPWPKDKGEKRIWGKKERVYASQAMRAKSVPHLYRLVCPIFFFHSISY